jgi:lysophospholipase L1-like esterase
MTTAARARGSARSHSLGRLAAAGLLSAPLLLVAASSATAAPTAQVGLGDSYAAGPLITPQDPTLPGCLRSLVDYPRLVAQREGFRITDVSCSGATTRDMTQPQTTNAGTNPPQLNALRATTGVVTLTIGGNDIGFSSIIQNCLAASPNGPTNSGARTCKQFYTAGGTDQLRARIRATRPKVDAVLAAIHRRSPHARVFLAGYPDILPERGTGCYPQMPLTTTDVPYLRGIEKALNQMLANSAAAHRTTYVDTYRPTIGHDACKLPGVRWIEPVIPVDAAPVHPNRLGERAMARAVERAIR